MLRAKRRFPYWLANSLAGTCAVAITTPGYCGDRGVVQIVAIAPAYCRVPSPASPALIGGRAEIGRIGQACNSVAGAGLTARIDNLGGGRLQIDGRDVALNSAGEVGLSADQLARTADWRLVDAARGDADGPVTLELTIVAN
jgi:hypothetical protein